MKRIIFPVLVFLTQLVSLFAADYVLAAERFEYTKGQNLNSVTNATAELIPQQILNNLNSNLERYVLPDELLERSLYNLRKDRYSLYLQLTSEYKKRDNIVLENLSTRELKKKIAEQEKKITELEEKINQNIQDVKDKQEESDKLSLELYKTVTNKNDFEKTELQKYSSLFKNLFVKDETLISIENINFYKKDRNALFNATDVSKEEGYESAVFEKEIIAAGIQTLITGKITIYGQYMSVSVSPYSYPGGKKLGTITEIASLSEIEFLCSSISRQLVPLLTNSLKLSLVFDVKPASSYQIFIDDALQSNTKDGIILDSGVHKIQVVAEGYEGLSTSFYFEGNQQYLIDILLEERDSGILHMSLLNPVPGTIYANSIPGVEKEDKVSEIKINGTKILGNFIDYDGNSDFYYVPEKILSSNDIFYISGDTRNRSDYIDLRRKRMYTGYTAFMISLIPTFYTNGQRKNYTAMNITKPSTESSNKAKGWKTAWGVCSGVSIAAGIYWGYELVRYLMSANMVLPEEAKIDKKGKLKQKQNQNIVKLQKAEEERLKQLEEEERSAAEKNEEDFIADENSLKKNEANENIKNQIEK